MTGNDKEFYHPLSLFINIFLAVLFSLSFREFYTIFTKLFDNFGDFPAFILIFITLTFFIDDAIEAQLLTFGHFKYTRLRRFYIDLLIYNLFYISILLAIKLSKFYFLTISLIFILFYLWSKYSHEEYMNIPQYHKLLNLIKTTCLLGSAPFFAIFWIMWYFDMLIDLKMSIYAAIMLCIYYFFYDLFGEILLEDLNFRGTGIFKPIIRWFMNKICHV